jgi:hypothetical protein
MLRRLFTLLSALSLLLCVGTCAMWVRSYLRYDQYAWVRVEGQWSIEGVLCTLPGYFVYSGRTLPHLSFAHAGSGFETKSGPEADKYRTEQSRFIHNKGIKFHKLGTLEFGSRRSRDRVVRSAIVPYWPLVILSGIQLIWWLVRSQRDRRRPRCGRCVSCGYDLRATPDRCPECGTETKIPAGVADGDKRTV